MTREQYAPEIMANLYRLYEMGFTEGYYIAILGALSADSGLLVPIYTWLGDHGLFAPFKEWVKSYPSSNLQDPSVQRVLENLRKTHD